MPPAAIPPNADIATTDIRASPYAVQARSSGDARPPVEVSGHARSKISNNGIQYTPVDSIATVVTPHWLSQSANFSKSSVNVAKTRTGLPAQSGGTATYISRAPTSTPPALGSKTGLSSKDIPLRFFPFCATAFSFPFWQQPGHALSYILSIGIDPRFARTVTTVWCMKPGAILLIGL